MKYDNYYSSADAQIYLFSQDSDLHVKLDTTVAIAYNLTQTSTPIYSLGNRVARYFSTGNTVCNGVLALAFSDEEYIKYCIRHVTRADTGNGSSTKTNTTTAEAIPADNKAVKRVQSPATASNAEVKAASEEQQLPTIRVTATSSNIISIGSVSSLFDIKIYLNNESIFRGSDSKVITLRGVKLVGDSMEINSSSDSYLTTGYKFMFKDIIRQ